jgi:hypothetical protein
MQIIPRWSTLRTIGRSRLARATIFIPIIGYLFIFNDEITGYLKLIPRFGSNGSAAELADINLSRLICLYVGLFCIGIGSIIFAIFCPSHVSENIDEHEFIVKEMDIMNPFRFDLSRQRIVQLRHLGSSSLQSEIDRLAKVELSDTLGAAEARVPELKGRGLPWNDWLNRNRRDLSSIISVQYNLLDQSKKIVRLLITILYVIGLIFLLLPSAQVFIRSLSLLKIVGLYLFRL